MHQRNLWCVGESFTPAAGWDLEVSRSGRDLQQVQTEWLSKGHKVVGVVMFCDVILELRAPKCLALLQLSCDRSWAAGTCGNASLWKQRNHSKFPHSKFPLQILLSCSPRSQKSLLINFSSFRKLKQHIEFISHISFIFGNHLLQFVKRNQNE